MSNRQANIERAIKITSSWPAWKRNYQLTKYRSTRQLKFSMTTKQNADGSFTTTLEGDEGRGMTFMCTQTASSERESQSMARAWAKQEATGERD